MRLVRRAVVVLLVAVLVVLAVTAFQVWSVGRADQRDNADTIVVLGAAQFQGRPSEVFEARLDHAHSLFTELVAPRIITVGGGRPGDRVTEAAAGKRYLEQQGVAAKDVHAVEQGGNTLESMRAVAAFMKRQAWHSAVLVTDPWHELRARAMASDQGIRATTSPPRSGPAVRTVGTQVRYIGRETLAYLYYLVFRRNAEYGGGTSAV